MSSPAVLPEPENFLATESGAQSLPECTRATTPRSRPSRLRRCVPNPVEDGGESMPVNARQTWGRLHPIVPGEELRQRPRHQLRIRSRIPIHQGRRGVGGPGRARRRARGWIDEPGEGTRLSEPLRCLAGVDLRCRGEPARHSHSSCGGARLPCWIRAAPRWPSRARAIASHARERSSPYAVLGGRQRSRSGQGPQRQSNTARRLGVIATVWPAGQVTVLACRSTAKFGRLGTQQQRSVGPLGAGFGGPG